MTRTYTLEQVVAASAAARFCTPAQFDYALASDMPDAAARLMLVSGASFLVECERMAHPRGTVLLDVLRRERILDEVMPEVELRRVEASMIDFHVCEHGDDEVPADVFYSALRNTLAGWADSPLG